MTPEEIRLLAHELESELLTRSQCGDPPPADHDAERMLVASLLAGWRPEVGVDCGDFHQPLLAWLWDAGTAALAEGMPVHIEALLVALREAGWLGPVERELLHLRDEVPTVSHSELEAAAVRVVEFARRRRLLAILETECAALRCGIRGAQECVQNLRRVRDAAA